MRESLPPVLYFCRNLKSKQYYGGRNGFHEHGMVSPFEPATSHFESPIHKNEVYKRLEECLKITYSMHRRLVLFLLFCKKSYFG